MAAVFKRVYYVKNPKTGKREKCQTAKYYGQFTDAGGNVHRVPLATDKEAALSMLVELIKKSERGHANLSDPFAKHTGRLLSEHITDFERSTCSKEVTAKYAKMTAQRLRAMVAGCEFRVIADINVDKVSTWLAEQRATQKRFGIGTTNRYAAAMATFCYWLCDPKRGNRCAINPYGEAPVLNEQTDVRRQRRALSEDEIAWLLDSTDNGPTLFGMTGRDRAMLYRMALMTGLRANELRTLTQDSFRLAGDRPAVVVEACYSKHRRKDVVPLHPEIVPLLQQWLADLAAETQAEPSILSLKGTPAGASGRVWNCIAIKERHTAETLRKDLAIARARWIEASADARERQAREASEFLVYKTKAGYADFHALRHGFITRVFGSGIQPLLVQKLARHSDLSMTMRYAHTEEDEVALAQTQVKPLPRLTSPSPAPPASASVAAG
jgi:integrase